jgi:hypothetical protein
MRWSLKVSGCHPRISLGQRDPDPPSGGSSWPDGQRGPIVDKKELAWSEDQMARWPDDQVAGWPAGRMVRRSDGRDGQMARNGQMASGYYINASPTRRGHFFNEFL